MYNQKQTRKTFSDMSNLQTNSCLNKKLTNLQEASD